MNHTPLADDDLSNLYSMNAAEKRFLNQQNIENNQRAD